MTLDTTYFNQDDLYGQVLKINISASPVEPWSTTSLLHWRFFAVLGERSAVLFDLRPEDDSRNGYLQLSSKKHQISSTSVGRFPFDTAKPTTIKNIIDLQVENRRDTYVYNDEGAGCRYWTRVVVGDFERAGIIAEGSSAQVLANIAQLSARIPHRVPMPEAQGTFE